MSLRALIRAHRGTECSSRHCSSLTLGGAPGIEVVCEFTERNGFAAMHVFSGLVVHDFGDQRIVVGSVAELNLHLEARCLIYWLHAAHTVVSLLARKFLGPVHELGNPRNIWPRQGGGEAGGVGIVF